MAIPLSRYVSITSGVGANNGVVSRNLGGLIVAVNTLIPTGTVLTFNNAADVGTYFGTASGEYLRAQFYFGWISKRITIASQLSFWFWNNDAATGSLIFGKPATYALGSFTGVTTGDFTLTLGGFTFHMTGINLSAAGSLAAVAADIQTAVRAQSGGGTAWTSATVTYDATRGCFDLTSGTTGADTVSVTAGVTTDVASLLGWLTGAILSNGTAAQLLNANLAQLINISNNFGSFCLGASSTITEANVIAAATWNYSLTPNNQFIFAWPVSTVNAATWQAAVANIGGQTGTLQSPVTGEYPEMVPMMILAATDYTGINTVQNYEFQTFNLTPSVTTNTDANTYDALKINYYGVTQTAGVLKAFYQQGLMSGGGATDPTDQNVYANEIWFKDAMAVTIMSALLNLNEIPATAQGTAIILTLMQSVITQAIINGTIELNKTLTVQQQLYITQATGDTNAWRQVQTNGYWRGVSIQTYTNNGVTLYKAVYTLIYSKNDVIRLVTGSDILI